MSRVMWVVFFGSVMLSACAQAPTLDQTRATLATPQTLPPVADEAYRIGEADVLRIHVFDEPGLTFEEIVVDSTGAIPFPLIGTLVVAGRTGEDVADEIAVRLARRFIKDPQVTVFVAASARQRLTVEGDVAKPGIFDLKGDTSLLQAIALAEGPTQTAKLGEVIVFRHVGEQVFAAQFDLRKVRMGIEPNVPLEGGDIVVIGNSRARGLFRDALQASPLLTALFVRII